MITRTARAFSVVALATVLSGVGAGVASADDIDSKPPTSSVPGHQVQGEHHTRYCLRNYAPNSDVTVTNEKTGNTMTIHTNADGVGCADVPIQPGCQTVSAQNSTDAQASSANVCVLGTQHVNSGALPFTGTGVAIPGTIAGCLLLIVGSGLLVVVRRRRGASAAG